MKKIQMVHGRMQSSTPALYDAETDRDCDIELQIGTEALDGQDEFNPDELELSDHFKFTSRL